VESNDFCAWPCFCLGVSFLCFSNLVVSCLVEIKVKLSPLLKLFGCKSISIVSVSSSSCSDWPCPTHMYC
jgi:hypothetical protein